MSEINCLSVLSCRLATLFNNFWINYAVNAVLCMVLHVRDVYATFAWLKIACCALAVFVYVYMYVYIIGGL